MKSQPISSLAKDSRSRVCVESIGSTKVLHIEATHSTRNGTHICLRESSLNLHNPGERKLYDNAICIWIGGMVCDGCHCICFTFI